MENDLWLKPLLLSRGDVLPLRQCVWCLNGNLKFIRQAFGPLIGRKYNQSEFKCHYFQWNKNIVKGNYRVHHWRCRCRFVSMLVYSLILCECFGMSEKECLRKEWGREFANAIYNRYGVVVNLKVWMVFEKLPERTTEFNSSTKCSATNTN